MSYCDEEDLGAVEEMVLADESTCMPLEADRTAELAMECWNLRKSIFDQNSDSLKAKQQISRFKNLIKNLQIIVASKEKEISSRNKEIMSLKEHLIEVERKAQTLTTSNNQLTLNMSKARKHIANLETKVNTSHIEAVDLKNKYITAKRELTEEFNLKESALLREINQLSEERDILAQENSTLSEKLQDEMMRTRELTTQKDDLTEKLAVTEKEVESSASFFTSELEDAYESLHTKLEVSLGENMDLAARIAKLEHENQNLQTFILTEGLQLPS